MIHSRLLKSCSYCGLTYTCADKRPLFCLSHPTVHPKAAKVYSLRNIDTHCPSTLRFIAAATAFIQRRTLLHLAVRENS